VEEGIADFGLIINIFEPSNLPLDQHGRMMPFGPRDSRLTIEIDSALRAAVPAMNKAYTEHNQRFLRAGANMDTGLFTTFPVRTTDDLKGHKFGASGTMGAYFKGTGGVYVSSAMVNAYADIKNGLYDGFPIALAFGFPFKLFEAAPYYNNVGFGTAANSVLSINLDRWKELPRWVQKIFADVGAQYVDAYAKIDEGRYRKFAGIMKKKGVKFYDMPESERTRWAKAMPNIALDWVRKNEARGHPARGADQLHGPDAQAQPADPTRLGKTLGASPRRGYRRCGRDAAGGRGRPADAARAAGYAWLLRQRRVDPRTDEAKGEIAKA